MTTRRTFLSRSSAVAAGLSLGLPSRRTAGAPPRARLSSRRDILFDPTIQVEADPTVRTLALRAIDAARAAGATYADVRLTRTLYQGCQGGYPRSLDANSETYAVGVRALVSGYWGFAASSYWTPDEMVLLAHDAVAQAKSNALGATRPAELGAIPMASGSWRTPITIDPFTVPIEEKEEFLGSIADRAQQYYHGAWAYPRSSGGAWFPVSFTRQERAVATTEGAYFTQTTYESGGDFDFLLRDVENDIQKWWHSGAHGLGLRGMGWEMFFGADLPAQFPALVAHVEEQMRLTSRAGDVGKYDVVFDAASMAALVGGTIGDATQLDRAMGYEANAGGTSYLDDPLTMLGSYNFDTPLLTVTANRSAPTQLATVKWDDEGVEPDDFTLVKDGVFVDYQTTREQAAWLKEYYTKAGKPVRSHGCAAADSAASITMQHTPNLAMAPAPTNITFDDLVRDTRRGFAVFGASTAMDWQGRTGAGRCAIREITNGKLGAAVTGLDFIFSAKEIWKNLKAIGGPASVTHVPFGNAKGQPAQATHHTVSAVPAKVVNVTFIDPARKS